MNENIEMNEAMENEELTPVSVPAEDTEIVYDEEETGMTIGDWVKLGAIGVVLGGAFTLGKKGLEWGVNKFWTWAARKAEQRRVDKAIRENEKIVSDRNPEKEDKE